MLFGAASARGPFAIFPKSNQFYCDFVVSNFFLFFFWRERESKWNRAVHNENTLKKCIKNHIKSFKFLCVRADTAEQIENERERESTREKPSALQHPRRLPCERAHSPGMLLTLRVAPGLTSQIEYHTPGDHTSAIRDGLHRVHCSNPASSRKKERRDLIWCSAFLSSPSSYWIDCKYWVSMKSLNLSVCPLDTMQKSMPISLHSSSQSEPFHGGPLH